MELVPNCPFPSRVKMVSKIQKDRPIKKVIDPAQEGGQKLDLYFCKRSITLTHTVLLFIRFKIKLSAINVLVIHNAGFL